VCLYELGGDVLRIEKQESWQFNSTLVSYLK
jgi:hypothetical protein